MISRTFNYWILIDSDESLRKIMDEILCEEGGNLVYGNTFFSVELKK